MTRQYVQRNQKSPQNDDSWILQRTAVRELPSKNLIPQVKRESLAQNKPRNISHLYRSQSSVSDDSWILQRTAVRELPSKNLIPQVKRESLAQNKPRNISHLYRSQSSVSDVGEQRIQDQPRFRGLSHELPGRSASCSVPQIQTKLTLHGANEIAVGDSWDLTSAINTARSGGKPLDVGLQKAMGQAMGADFTGVRVHTDTRSDQLNRSIQAKAFTTGQDVFFRQGEYQPGTRGGQETIAHELTHVLQQSGGEEQPIKAKLTIGAPADLYEQEADQVASQVVQQINAPSSAQSSLGQSLKHQEEPKSQQVVPESSKIKPKINRRLNQPYKHTEIKRKIFKENEQGVAVDLTTMDALNKLQDIINYRINDKSQASVALIIVRASIDQDEFFNIDSLREAIVGLGLTGGEKIGKGELKKSPVEWDNDELRDAVNLAQGLAISVETSPNPKVVGKKQNTFQQRQKDIEEAYQKIQKGLDKHPTPGVTKERLKLAYEGDEKGRVPLTFDKDQFREFQQDLKSVFESEGITDAVVQQVGSATTGFRGNPNKEFGPWKPTSDTDLAVFSNQALVQADKKKLEANQKIVQSGRYTVYKNAPKDKGFYTSPLGKKLAELALRWNHKIYGDMIVDGFDFKLNLSTQPFTRAITVLDQQKGIP
ncbi:DUF4157 domain-containing protein [Moorena producens]|uniref:eCIS core domain-containing protein n=1 Tax=Moorena producens TaxID=1155739 RepID=UPI003C7802A5